MLKKICRLFLGLVVFMGSACVTPTHASSAFSGIILTHIQAASPTSAKDEMVSFYNNSPNEVDVTNWCLKNKANVSFVCFTPPTSQSEYYLPAYSFAVVVSESFLSANGVSAEAVTKVFAVTNQSSGSMVNSADTVSLVDSNGQVSDSISWTVAIPTGKVMIRTKTGTDPRVYETLDSMLAWSSGALTQLPANQVEVRETPPIETPEDPTDSGSDIPSTQNPKDISIHPYVTELFPDAVGGDIGKEFIELYNPTSIPINLNDYKLRVGANLEKVYSFPANSVVSPLSYAAYTNGQIPFTLINTSSKVQLEYKGSLVEQAVSYSDPPEGQSWSLIDDAWQYTSMATPGDANQLPELISNESESQTDAPTLKPCAVNQYRSPETNRCRLLVTAASAEPQPCKEGQVRNLETNRCRTIAATSSTPTPCKAGQERSPETNRCRNVTKMSNVDYAVKGVSTEHTSTNWYMWLGIGGIVTLILGYAIWEWREELRQLADSLRQKVARLKR